MSTVHILRLHAGYRCRHAGICCSEPWAIPVDAPLRGRLQMALDEGRLHPERLAEKYFDDDDADNVSLVGRLGRECAFFEPGRGRLCAIHRALGPDLLPSACQHFPRVVVIDPRGVFVSVSHVCPTAGALLRDSIESPFEVVHEGPIVSAGMAWSGLDARQALPPAVSSAVLWDWDGLTAWERGILSLLGRHAPEHVVWTTALAARRIEQWTPSTGRSLSEVVATALGASCVEGHVAPFEIATFDRLARAASADPGVTPPPVDFGHADTSLVAPRWRHLQALASRYLAARVMANAVGYHSPNARVWAASIATAYAVLRVEAARQASSADRLLDAELLVAAAAAADRLLVHQVDAGALARSLQEVT